MNSKLKKYGQGINSGGHEDLKKGKIEENKRYISCLEEESKLRGVRLLM